MVREDGIRRAGGGGGGGGWGWTKSSAKSAAVLARRITCTWLRRGTPVAGVENVPESKVHDEAQADEGEAVFQA